MDCEETLQAIHDKVVAMHDMLHDLTDKVNNVEDIVVKFDNMISEELSNA